MRKILLQALLPSIERRMIMLKRISIILLPILMVATLMVCAATQVIAQENGFDVVTDCGKYTIWALGESPIRCDGGDCEVPGTSYTFNCSEYPCFLWVFEANCGQKDLERLKYLTFNIPVQNPPIEVVGPEDAVYYSAGEGAYGFGQGINTGRVVRVDAKWNSDRSKKIGYFATTIQTDGAIDPAAVYRKWCYKVESCAVALRGPGISLPPYAALPSFTRISVDIPGQSLVDYCVEIDGRTGCPDPVDPGIFLCDCVDSNPLNYREECVYVEGELPPDRLVRDEFFTIGSGEDQAALLICQAPGVDPRCPICKVGHNPCTWITLGGVPFGPICW
jgi:hypothetical protein